MTVTKADLVSERWEITALIGPCTQDDALTLLERLATEIGDPLGAAWALHRYPTSPPGRVTGDPTERELRLISTEIGLLADIWRRPTTSDGEASLILKRVMKLQDRERELGVVR